MWIKLPPKLALAFAYLATIGCGNSTSHLIAELKHSEPAVRRAAARSLGEYSGSASAVSESLAVALADSDVEVRELAAQSLGQLGPDARTSLPALQRALNDSASSVRLCAALAIQKLEPDSPTYQSVLIQELQAGDGPVFIEIARLGETAEWAVPTLVKLLSHQQPNIRALAARALGGIGAAAAEAKPALTQRLRDPDRTVQKAAQKALQEIESPISTTAR